MSFGYVIGPSRVRVRQIQRQYLDMTELLLTGLDKRLDRLDYIRSILC